MPQGVICTKDQVFIYQLQGHGRDIVIFSKSLGQTEKDTYNTLYPRSNRGIECYLYLFVASALYASTCYGLVSSGGGSSAAYSSQTPTANPANLRILEIGQANLAYINQVCRFLF
ncbi:hypothetical protein L211DRAFT_701546 [Terfezia boudieri ATCC MYA-4762]|uniref:Uncharacterized protein n=1 Tax=Terfezia boudieri ATCC MYA-4762 TaxID=1051890 RepID=A0A3N4M8H3_9PEZI|nr:hypothetical protein L211DRAFT_701546 [Terfezia boudieri ATCC MYA-4762]